MKKSTIYQYLKIQILYFFVAYELFNTQNIKLFVVLYSLVLFDVLYNAKNIFQAVYPLNAPSDLDTNTNLKKWDINKFFSTILFFWLCFLLFVLFVRKEFWIILF